MKKQLIRAATILTDNKGDVTIKNTHNVKSVKRVGVGHYIVEPQHNDMTQHDDIVALLEAIQTPGDSAPDAIGAPLTPEELKEVEKLGVSAETYAASKLVIRAMARYDDITDNELAAMKMVRENGYVGRMTISTVLKPLAVRHNGLMVYESLGSVRLTALGRDVLSCRKGR